MVLGEEFFFSVAVEYDDEVGPLIDSNSLSPLRGDWARLTRTYYDAIRFVSWHPKADRQTRQADLFRLLQPPFWARYTVVFASGPAGRRAICATSSMRILVAFHRLRDRYASDKVDYGTNSFFTPLV